MLYKLTKKIKGQVITDCIDTLSVVNRRKKALTASYRGQGVILNVTPADDTDEKYQKPLLLCIAIFSILVGILRFEYSEKDISAVLLCLYTVSTHMEC